MLSCCQNARHVYHRFVIRCLNRRNELKHFLLRKGIQVKIHYSKNIHSQNPFKDFGSYKHLKKVDQFSKQILSLPINQFNTKEEVIKICKLIRGFYS